MARYKLMHEVNGEGEHEVGGQRKNTKAEIERWIEDNARACVLKWRSGFTVAFERGEGTYTWRWIKDDKIVKV